MEVCVLLLVLFVIEMNGGWLPNTTQPDISRSTTGSFVHGIVK